MKARVCSLSSKRKAKEGASGLAAIWAVQSGRAWQCRQSCGALYGAGRREQKSPCAGWGDNGLLLSGREKSFFCGPATPTPGTGSSAGVKGSAFRGALAWVEGAALTALGMGPSTK